MAEKKRALAFVAPREARIISVPRERPGPGQIAVEAECSQISAGPERSLFLAPPVTPFTPGYSLVGRVSEVGAGVTEFRLGDRVAATAPHKAVAVCDARLAIGVPSAISSDDAAFFNVANMALHGLRLAKPLFGEPFAILGLGLIGLIAVQAARFAGALPVIGTDLRRERLALAHRLGCDHPCFAADEELNQLLASFPNGGPVATLELTGNPQAIDQAIAITRVGGRVVTGSASLEGYKVNIYGAAWEKGLQLVGGYANARPWRVDKVDMTSPMEWPPRLVDSASAGSSVTPSNWGDLQLFFRLLASRRIDVTELVSRRVDPEEAASRFDELVSADTLGVLIHW